jgi:hypothetical protein
MSPKLSPTVRDSTQWAATPPPRRRFVTEHMKMLTIPVIEEKN